MRSRIVNPCSFKKNHGIALIIAVTWTCIAHSQNSKVFVINPGQKVSDVVSPVEMYRYSGFKQGSIFFKDGNESSAPLNYNLFLNEVQFINPKGDTLSLADEKLIRLIRIDDDSFFYNKGCYEMINSFDHINLVKKQVIRIASVNKIGVNDQPVMGGSASTYTRFNSGIRDVNLALNEKVTLKKEVSYYLEDQDGRLIPVSKKNLQKEFPKSTAVIENYLQKNTVDFKAADNIEKLFSYIKQSGK